MKNVRKGPAQNEVGKTAPDNVLFVTQVIKNRKIEARKKRRMSR
jgi:hypothetical protein